MTLPVRCRGCNESLGVPFLQLGDQPLANDLLPSGDDLDKEEPKLPLDLYHCTHCHFVQLPALALPDMIFSDYVYFSSYSKTWTDHAQEFAAMVHGEAAGRQLFVVEAASNDGYLLKPFKELGHRVLGIEPAENVARVAIAAGIPTEMVFFGAATAHKVVAAHGHPDYFVANNVLAHVPNIHDFVAGIAILIGNNGKACIEFPHLLEIIRGNQFDTIYHEHFSYLSMTGLLPVLETHGLQASRVDRLPTHGGSLRLWVEAASNPSGPPDSSIDSIIAEERKGGLEKSETYAAFARAAKNAIESFRSMLLKWRNEGLKVAAYGAPAKGNTLLNAAHVDASLIQFTVDANPVKQGKLLPGSRVPIYAPAYLRQHRPDRLIILPWNIQREIHSSLDDVEKLGTLIYVPIPTLTQLTPPAWTPPLGGTHVETNP